MNPALVSFAGAAVGLILLAGAAPVVLRLPLRLSPVGRLALLAVLIHTAATALMIWFEPSATYWHGAALFWFGFNCLLYAFSAVYKSVSLRILSRLAAEPDQRLAMQDIVQKQISPCFTDRVALLVSSGLAHAEGGRYRPLPEGVKTAGRIGFLQRLFGVKQSGLYTATQPEAHKYKEQTPDRCQVATMER